MKNIILKVAAVFAALFIFALTSCSGIIGYSVVLWNIGDQKITDGTVVPVYLKSNISHVYVISAPDSEEKIEVPLWKLSEPKSKGKAKKLAKRTATTRISMPAASLTVFPSVLNPTMLPDRFTVCARVKLSVLWKG